MSTFGTMNARIADELARSDLTTTQIPRSVLSAIEHYKDERFWFNELKDTASTVSGTQNYLMPDSAAERPLIRIDQLQITVNSNIIDLGMPVPHSEILARTTNASHTGYPDRYSYYQDSVWLYPIPNGAYTLTLWYVGQLAALSADADTNAWVVEAEELIRCRAKWDLYLHVIRDRAEAADMKAAEMDALRTLRGRRDMRVSSELRGWL
jgi:hypothetical protein